MTIKTTNDTRIIVLSKEEVETLKENSILLVDEYCVIKDENDDYIVFKRYTDWDIIYIGGKEEDLDDIKRIRKG